jgi:hypothetical protein
MRNAQSIGNTEDRLAAQEDFRNKKQFNQRQGNVTYIRRAKTETVPLEPMRIDAPFYNNMITLDRGLMVPKENVETQVNKLVDTIIKTPGIDRDSLAITVTGAATTARPSTDSDTRMPAGTKLDHPGKSFDGIDVSKPENYNAGNQWLATQRAQAIINVLKPKLEAAGFKNLKLKTAAIVLPGGPRDDDKRFLKVDVNVQQKTNDIITTANLFLNFTVTYEATTGRSVPNAISNIQSKVTPDQQVGTSTEVQSGYKASIAMTYGQEDKDGFSFKFNWGAVAAAKDSMAGSNRNIKIGYTDVAAKKLDLTPGVDNTKLNAFLSTCGRFKKNQVTQIINDLQFVDSKLFKAIAQKGKGSFEDFVAAAGGSTQPVMSQEYGIKEIADMTASPPVFDKV